MSKLKVITDTILPPHERPILNLPRGTLFRYDNVLYLRPEIQTNLVLGRKDDRILVINLETGAITDVDHYIQVVPAVGTLVWQYDYEEKK